jgi:23S rRNA pseudouridine1911/1915/1917 synthase
VQVQIRYADEELIVVDKPPGVVVHPTYKNDAGTLLDHLGWAADRQLSIVTRLDKFTSGLVLVAKHPEAHAALQREMSAGDAEKDYLALVYGHVEPESGRIDLPLRVDDNDRRRVVTSPDRGRASTTWFERLKSIDAPRAGLTLLRCRLETGRRHQIRAHLAAAGFPIVGDRLYGQPRWTLIDDPMVGAALEAFPRQALHAWRLAFRHPRTGAALRFEAEAPDDFRGLLGLLSGHEIAKGGR